MSSSVLTHAFSFFSPSSAFFQWCLPYRDVLLFFMFMSLVRGGGDVLNGGLDSRLVGCLKMCLRLLVVHQALKCGLRLTLAGIRTRGWTLVVTVGPSGVSPLLVVRKGTVTLSPTFVTACLLPLPCRLHPALACSYKSSTSQDKPQTLPKAVMMASHQKLFALFL